MIRTAMIPLATLLVSALGVAAQAAPSDSLEARVWLDRGDEPLVHRGDDVRVYYRTSVDAWVAIFRIDTDGRIELLFPHHPDEDTRVRGGRDYRLLFPTSARWRVGDDPGAGYFFMVASPEPLDFSLFDFDEGGWDLSAVGSTVYEDPYVAIDDYVAAIVPDWDVVPYALDFLTYHVEQRHSYPRFLCYDCHDARSYARWNPYDAACSTYRVVVWDDPYFHPGSRYFGTRVVYARPFGPRPRYGVVVRTGSAWTPVVRVREAPPRRVAAYKESATRAPSYQPRNPTPSRGVAPTRPRGSRVGPAPSRVGPRVATPRRGTPSSRVAPGAQSGSGAARAAPPRASGVTRPGSTTGGSRPTLQRRPEKPSVRLPGRAPSRGAAARPSGRDGRVGSPPARPNTRAVPRRGTAPPRAGTASPPNRPPAGARPSGRSRPSAGSPARPSAGSRPRPTSGARPRPTSGSRPPPTAGRPSRPTAGSRPPNRVGSASARPARRPPPPSRRPPPRRPGGSGSID